MNDQQKAFGRKKSRFLLITALTLLFVVTFSAQTQLTYKTGDRVECDSTESGKWWTKGTIFPFQKGDFGGGQEPDGSWYRFKADYNGGEYPCKPGFIRALPVDTAVKAAGPPNIVTQVADKRTVTPADNDFVECPIKQKPAKNGARPDSELAMKIIRCKKGEKAVEPGDEGAVKVEVATVQIGTARPWTYRQDSGNGKLGTLVYPVKATYSVKTLYRKATEIEDGWVRILNFYVNAFGEWEIGSEEPIKSPKVSRVPK